jgi:hypothetical protein
VDDGGAGIPAIGKDQSKGGARPGKALRDQQGRDEVGSRAAVFFRNPEAEEAQLGRGLVQVAGEGVRRVDLRCARPNTLAGQPVDGFQDLLPRLCFHFSHLVWARTAESRRVSLQIITKPPLTLIVWPVM